MLLVEVGVDGLSLKMNDEWRIVTRRLLFDERERVPLIRVWANKKVLDLSVRMQ